MRVETGGRLVEEEHLRVTEEARGQVEPPAHAARVGLHGAVCGLGEPEPLQHGVGAGAGGGPPQVQQAADQIEVLPRGDVLVDGRVLAGHADQVAYLAGLACHVVAVHEGLPCVRLDEGAQHAHGRRLAGSVGSQQPEDGALGHLEGHAPHRVGVTELLRQVCCAYRRGRDRHRVLSGSAVAAANRDVTEPLYRWLIEWLRSPPRPAPLPPRPAPLPLGMAETRAITR